HHHRPAVRRRISINQRDFHRFAPAWERKPIETSEEQVTDCVRRRTLRRGPKHEHEVRELRRTDRFMPIIRREQSEEDRQPNQLTEASSRETFTIVQMKDKSFDTPTVVVDEQQRHAELMESYPEDTPPVDEEEMVDQTTDRTMAAAAPASEEEIQLFTPAPRTSEERQIVPRLQPTWSLESTSAEVAEMLPKRFKRSFPAGLVLTEQPAASIESEEVQRLEDFFRTNAKLQQKFAEMFDLLLEAIEELEAEDNNAREVSDDDNGDDDVPVAANEPSLKRTKRNVLLHPQSWESRERSNMIQRRHQQSEEFSYENLVLPEQAQQPKLMVVETAGQSALREAREDDDAQPPDSGKDDEGKPGAFMLRSVVNFVRRASNEFHQLFSGWFGKNS
uniref:Uncharacterized protein n=1 Tax=Anopheles maculatus TaxID=74869 RepID=A0A182T0G4_9DIPT